MAGNINQKAVIYTASSSLKGVMRDGLRQVKITETIALEKTAEVLNELKNDAFAWLLIDFAAPPQELNRVLQAAQGPSAIETRPIYVIGSEMNSNTIVAAIEYNVGKIRLGTFTPKEINEDIKALAATNSANAPIRESMAEVQKLIQAGDLEQAGNLLRDLAQKHQDDPRVVCEYVHHLVQVNAIGEAFELIEKLEELEPDYLKLKHLKARCLMKRKQYDEAIKILKTAEKTNPWNISRLNEYGAALLQTSQFKDAGEKFSRTLDVDPQNQTAKAGQAQAVMLSGNIDEGISHVRNLGSPRQMAATLNSAAVMAARTDRLPDARELYTKGIQLLRDDPISSARLWYNLGILEYRDKKMDVALKCFETSKQQDPKFSAADYNIKILRQMKKTGFQTSEEIHTNEISDVEEAGPPVNES